MNFQLLLAACGFLSTANMILAKPLHADLNYARYLQEIHRENSTLDQELVSYFATDAFQECMDLGLWAREDRSADPTEDERQRFFMASELVDKLNQEYPDAEFTLQSPFTMLTKQEFMQYVGLTGGNMYQDDENDEEALLGYRALDNDRRLSSWSWSSNTNFRQSTDDTNGKVRTSNDFRQNQNSDDNKQRSKTPCPSSNRRHYNNNDSSDDHKKRSPAPCPSSKNRRNNNNRPTTPCPSSSNPYNNRTPRPTSGPNPAPAPRPGPGPQPQPDLPVAPTESPSDVTPSSAPVPSDGSGVNWMTRGFVNEVRNQGSCGSCWAFAATAAIESALCIKSGKNGNCPKLSEQMMTSCDSSNKGCGGGNTAKAMNFIKGKGGQCSAQSYPYVGRGGNCQSCSGTDLVQFSIQEAVRTGGDAAKLKAAVDQQPVVVSVAAGNSAWKQYKGGVLTESTCPSSNTNHAVLLYGYTNDAWLIKNSWGTKWGENGLIRLSRSGNPCSVLKSATYPRVG